MPTSAEGYAVDTSVAVAALDAGHAAHAACRKVVAARRPALAGHAAFEVQAVLTRMPGPLRVDPPVAASIAARVFPEVCWLRLPSARSLFARLGTLGVSGSAVYDALVGEAARVNHRILLTRDRRAVRTYELIGVTYELV